MTGCVTTEPAARAPRGPAVIAHRGASAYAPENTLAAFRVAHEMGADYFELDCTLARDGRVVVIHDDDLERTAGVKQDVDALDWDALRQLDVGAWFSAEFAGQRIPSLAETLDWAKGRIGVYIEIKRCSDDEKLAEACMAQLPADGGVWTTAQCAEAMALIEAADSCNLALTRRVLELVRERDMAGEVVLQSFSPIVCAVARFEAPELRVEFLGVDDDKNAAIWETFVKWGHLIGVQGFNIHKDAASPARIAAFHEAGKTVAVWTVDDADAMQRLAGWGVDGLITNKPDLCRRVLNPQELAG